MKFLLVNIIWMVHDRHVKTTKMKHLSAHGNVWKAILRITLLIFIMVNFCKLSNIHIWLHNPGWLRPPVFSVPSNHLPVGNLQFSDIVQHTTHPSTCMSGSFNLSSSHWCDFHYFLITVHSLNMVYLSKSSKF